MTEKSENQREREREIERERELERERERARDKTKTKNEVSATSQEPIHTWGLKWVRAERSKIVGGPFQTPTPARTKAPPLQTLTN